MKLQRFAINQVSPVPVSNEWHRLIFILLLLTNFTSVAPAQTKQWDKTIGGDSYDELFALQQTSDGGYILGGSSESHISGDKTEPNKGEIDYWIVKVSAAGQKEWDRTLGGNDIDILSSLQQTNDGGYILGGYSSSGISGDKTEASEGASDFWVVKLDAAGQKEWDRTFGGSNFDFLRSLQQTSDGGFILGGSSSSPISGDKTEASKGASDYWVVKLDVAGQKEWDRTLGGSSSDVLTSLQQTSDGGYILGGSSESPISGNKSETSRGETDYWLVKLNAAGQIVWDKTYGGSESDELTSLQQTSDGGYILGGTSSSPASGDKTEGVTGGCGNFGCLSDYWVVKLDINGQKQWDKTIGGNGTDRLTSLQQTSDGGYILGGSSSSPISGDKTEPNRGCQPGGFCPFDYWVVQLDATGQKQWDKTFGGSDTDNLTSLQQTSDGGYILGGWSESDISGDKTEPNWSLERCDEGECTSDYWIVKLLEAICTPPVPTITIISSSNTYTGGDPAQLYLGYGPQSVTLQASGATTYAWSPATGLSSTTMADPVFTPTAPGTYTFTLLAANGTCTATTSVTITVTDVRCGNKNNKVLICHNGIPLCISTNAVQAHLRNHPKDKLGYCHQWAKAIVKLSQITVQAFPNPFTNSTTIAFTLPDGQEYTLQIFDLRGNLIEQWTSASTSSDGLVQINWSPNRAHKGIYVIRLLTKDRVQHLRLLRE